MKTQYPNFLARLWRRMTRGSFRAHDPFLSLSINDFNFSSGWDRLVQKQRELHG